MALTYDTGITSTMLGHIKSIKMSGLGEKLGDSIAQLRRDEIEAAAPFRLMTAVTSATAQMPSLLSPVAAFAFVTLRSGESLDVARMFTSLSLILLLSQPLFWMLDAILDASAALSCFKRIQAFLSKTPRAEGASSMLRSASCSNTNTNPTAQPSLETRPLELRDLKPASRGNAKVDVAIHNASFSWATGGPPVLQNLDMEVEQGQLAIIIGPVASGKTTLLKGLLGELPSSTGHVELAHQKVAWCEQTPWLFVSPYFIPYFINL
jgi:ABC-type multidrug transport system fused ATPase/permease subunit